MDRLLDYAIPRILAGLESLSFIGGPPVSDSATRFIIAVGKTESAFVHRFQRLNGGKVGPARGWWQFEQIGVRGVMDHQRSKELLANLCDQHMVDYDYHSIWRAIEGHDVFAAGLARLLLWTDPNRLPVTGNEGWECYNRTWRPGKPDRKRWDASWAMATALEL